MKINDVLILEARKRFHRNLINSELWLVSEIGIPSNADVGNKKNAKKGEYNKSTRIAQILASAIDVPWGGHDKKVGTNTVTTFEYWIAEYIRETFPYLQHLRPSKWFVMSLGNRGSVGSSDFLQYEHLDALSKYIAERRELAAGTYWKRL